MTIYRGSTPIVAVYRGSVPITTLYRGSVVIPTTGGIFDNFEYANGPLSSNWTDQGSSNDFLLGVQDGRARVLIPDGILGGFWDYRISYQRYNAAVNPGDDGYVECQPVTKGDPLSLTSAVGYMTEVFGRGSNSAATHGVGMRLRGGHAYIVRRVSGNTTVMTDCGTWQPGDILRLTFIGNLYTLYKNGVSVGVWNDSGTSAQVGSGYRSLIIRGDGAKDTIGPHRFSPALEYVRMG